MTDSLTQELHSGKFDAALAQAYPELANKREKVYARLDGLIDGFIAQFGANSTIRLFSAPGRTEIGGNHTDHQLGCVIAAAVNQDVAAAAAVNGTDYIRILSEGYPLIEININELEPVESEKNSTAALIRGITAKMSAMGYAVRGFDAYVQSSVLVGSGLSSSAAFEALVGTIINGLFCDSEISAIKIAQIGQYAENVYFGKPSGLMDQTASSVGSVVFIDFKDKENPQVQKIAFDLLDEGYALCVIDSGADHANLTDCYASITEEMGRVSAFFGQKHLRYVDKDEFFRHIAEVRAQTGDRAILRAIHYFYENERALREAELLKKGDFPAFLAELKDSGRSSYMLLQNVIVPGTDVHQEVAYALAVCEQALGGRGASRIQGGGFAGTIQAFVPVDMLESFREDIDHAIYPGACHILSIRSAGGIELTQ